MAFCSQCGKQIDERAAFCPYCGAQVTPYGRPASAAPQPSSNGTDQNYYSGSAPTETLTETPANTVNKFCGGWLALIFAILLSLNVLFGLVSGFSSWISALITIVVGIPALIMCIGCWLVYFGGLQRRPNLTGFTMISGALQTDLILIIIASAVLAVVGIVVGIMSLAAGAGAMGIAIIFGFLIFAAALIFLMVPCYRGLRRTVNSTKAISQGNDEEWQTSMFSIVMTCIGAGISLIGLIAMAVIRRIPAIRFIMQITGYGSASGISIMSTVFSILVAACGVTLLLMIRNRKPGAASAR